MTCECDLISASSKVNREFNVFLSLTAFLDGFVAPVRTVSGLVAHFAHLDTLPAATLELFWPITLSHCEKIKGYYMSRAVNAYTQHSLTFTKLFLKI